MVPASRRTRFAAPVVWVVLALAAGPGCKRRSRPLEVPEIIADDRAFDGAQRQTARAGEHPLAAVLIDAHPDGIAICESCHDPTSPMGLVASARGACLRCHDGRGVVAQVLCQQESDCDVPGGGAVNARCIASDSHGVAASSRSGPLPGRCGIGDRSEPMEVAPALRRGLDLLDDLACAACHGGDDLGLGGARLRGPSLMDARGGFAPGATQLSLASPGGLHSRLSYQLSPDEIALIDRLVSDPEPASDGGVAKDPVRTAATPEAIQTGRELAARLSCDGCHDGLDFAGALTARDDPRRFFLGDVGARLTEQRIAAFVESPRSRAAPGADGMPDFRLKAPEVASLTTYLASLRPASAPLAAALPLDDAEHTAAEVLWAAASCGACHAAAHGMPQRVARSLADAASRVSKASPEDARVLVRHERLPASALPRIRLSDGEADEVTLALRALVRRRAQPAPPRGKRERRDGDPREARIETLHGRLRQLRCDGCHELPGRAGMGTRRAAGPVGPPLELTAALTRPDWLRRWLLAGAATAVRPTHPARMPSYSFTLADLDRVVQGFAALAGIEARERIIPPRPLTSAERKQAALLMTQLRCTTCHGPDAPATQTPAPRLELAPERLRPEALRDYLELPARVHPTATMPALFDPASLNAIAVATRDQDGGPTPTDPDEAIRLVTTLLLTPR